MYIWRQGKNGPTRYAQLRRLGVSHFHAAVAAGSERGSWRMARHVAVQQVCPTPSSTRSDFLAWRRRQTLNSIEPPCTDPYARWCGRGGAARLPLIPIFAPNRAVFGDATPPVGAATSEPPGPSIYCRGGRATAARGPREPGPMGDVTRILADIQRGDRHAAGQLLPLVYDELRKLAAARLAHEVPGQTLQATALVHEAYLRLVGPDHDPPLDGRGHFFPPA